MDENNKDKLINNEKAADELGEETIVFRRDADDIVVSRQPIRVQKNSSATDQQVGGAVIRPLKSEQPNRPMRQTVINPQNQRASVQKSSQNVQNNQRNIQNNAYNQNANQQIARTNQQYYRNEPISSQAQPTRTIQQKQIDQRSAQAARVTQNTVRSQNSQPRQDQGSSSAQIKPINSANRTNQSQDQTVKRANQPQNLQVRRSPVTAAPTEPRRSYARDLDNDWQEIDRNVRRKSNARESASSAIMSAVKAVVYIVFVIAISIPLSIFVIRTANDVFAFKKEEKIIEVTIPEYTTIESLGDILGEAGIIEYPWAFKLWTNIKEKSNIENGNYPQYVAGTYEVNTNQNYDYIRAIFKKSTKRETVDVMIPEGSTVDEIIDILVANEVSTREELVDAINNYDFDYRFIDELTITSERTYRLEGYLFPDTYQFYKDSSAETAINKMLQNFNNKFADEYYDRCEQLNMTVDEAITLASMIEKEARYASDLGNVSSVFHNRLKYSASFPYLNSDATIAYAMQFDSGSRPDNLTGSDMSYDSPYNTYTHKGLPPGPISNPGLNSIKYALYPADSDYFYFVSDNSGHMLFGKTAAEHEKNIITARAS